MSPQPASAENTRQQKPEPSLTHSDDHAQQQPQLRTQTGSDGNLGDDVGVTVDDGEAERRVLMDGEHTRERHVRLPGAGREGQRREG